MEDQRFMMFTKDLQVNINNYVWLMVDTGVYDTGNGGNTSTQSQTLQDYIF